MFPNLSVSHRQSHHDDDFHSGCHGNIVNVITMDYIHLDEHTLPTYDITPGFKPFTVNIN